MTQEEVKKDLEYTIKNFEEIYKKAEEGDSESQHRVGRYYDNNHKKDFIKAEYWYKKAAELNYVGSMNNLGVLYDNKGNYEEAEYWYRRAIEQNNVKSIHNLGLLYHIIKENYEEAENWYKKAAELGNIYALDKCFNFQNVNLYQLFYNIIENNYVNDEIIQKIEQKYNKITKEEVIKLYDLASEKGNKLAQEKYYKETGNRKKLQQYQLNESIIVKREISMIV